MGGGDDDDNSEDPLDPRIQTELECLNKVSLVINRLENEIDEERGRFRTLLTESTHQLESLTKKLGSCIEKAKPYYDCRLRAKEVHVQTQQAATRYERAMGMQTAAREMVELAEQGYESKKPDFDMAWQEMLNHATMKVMDAENERMISEAEHERTAQLYSQVQEEVNEQYRENKRAIVKSKPYYEKKADFHVSLDSQKAKIETLQNDVANAKKLYSKALGNLEAISEEIHVKRKQSAEQVCLGKREAGVGSESPKPPPQDLKVINNNSGPEILISFPPVAPAKPRPQSKTINVDTPDVSVNITGIRIDVTQSPPVPDIVVENAQLTNSTNNSNEHKDSQDRSGSVNTSPVILRHKRGMSGSLKLSAKQLLHETSSLDSDSGSVCSFVALDDRGVVSAMADEYFDGSFEEELRESVHEDYSTLPESLARFQKPYETARRSVTSGAAFCEAELKLDQVLKLLESSEEGSIV